MSAPYPRSSSLHCGEVSPEVSSSLKTFNADNVNAIYALSLHSLCMFRECGLRLESNVLWLTTEFRSLEPPLLNIN